MSPISPRVLVIQLARLGDLLQSLPVITALGDQKSGCLFDLLCPSPLASLGACFPGISESLPWNAEDWATLRNRWDGHGDRCLGKAATYFQQYQAVPYSVAYNLNNHPRGILAAHLFADRVVGAGFHGPLSSMRPPWVEYVRFVAHHRGRNRIHLADAFCGMCGIQPPSTLPWLNVVPTELPEDLKQFGCHGMVSVALVIGAGDAERRIPIWTLREWINRFLSQSAEGRVLLVGGNGECELAHALQLELSPLVLNRVWNACGRTSLLQLVQLLSRCQWIMGSDTGPLHLGVSCGAKAMGWYFSRARVHETGPYGEGHWVWQAEQTVRSEELGVRGKERGIFPKEWPVRESVELMLGEGRVSIPEGWSLWRSDRDQNGVFFTEFGTSAIAPLGREHIWEVLSGEDLVKPDVLRDLLHTTRYSLSASPMMN